MSITLTPAECRDVKYAKDAIRSFLDLREDWIIANHTHWDGEPVSMSELRGETVTLKFCESRKTCVVNVPEEWK